MRKLYFIFFIIFYTSFITFSYSQEENNFFSETSENPQDSTKIIYEPTIYDYKYRTENKSFTIFDTILTIDKYYKNRIYTRKDYFGSMPFENIGQPFNPLLYTNNIDDNNIQLVPTGKSFDFPAINEIRYFDVKTPTAEFQYNNGVKQGQKLSTLFTHNINAQFNYSLEYQGLRSEGKYLNDLSASNYFLTSINGHTKNNRYRIWAHFISGGINNKENGGIKNLSNFEDGDSRFNGRNRLEVNLNTSKSEYNYQRVHLGQKLGIAKDSKDFFYFSLKNIFSYEKSSFVFNPNSDTYYSEIFSEFSGVRSGKFNKKYFNKFYDAFYLSFAASRFQLNIGGKVESPKLTYDYDLMLKDQFGTDSLYIPKKMEDTRYGLIGDINFNVKEHFGIQAKGEYMLGDHWNNTYSIEGALLFQPIKNYSINGEVAYKSVIPSLNLLSNQSYYKKFNYYLNNFNNEEIFKIRGTLRIKPFDTRFTARFFTIKNYTYIDSDYQSKQFSSDVRIMQYQLENLFSLGKFHLKTNLAYQKIVDNDEIMPLPEFVGRASLYYQSKIFKNNAEFQAGINAYYFSKFYSRAYFPLLNEFRLQDSGEESYKELGEYPLLDIFIHLKVKRMMIILEAEHFNASFTGYKYYSAPRYPFSDFRLNIGILWYLFN